MIAGYFLEQILGLVLAVAWLLAGRYKMSSQKRVLRRALESFTSCALFFAFSVEIAAIVVLVKEDFGFSTSGMGDATVRITQTVAVLVLLPLLYAQMTAMSALPADQEEKESSHTKPTEATDDESADEPTQSSRSFILLVLCWLMAFYPFYSKMNAEFGPSQISPSGAITPSQFAVIEEICTKGVSTITNAEDVLMTAFIMLAYFSFSLFVVGRILWLGLEKHHRDSKLYETLLRWRRKILRNNPSTGMQMVYLAVTPLLACALLWTILRTQRFQEEMASTLKSNDTDAQWTFGQVVAVTVFAPVIVESWSAFQGRRRTAVGGHGT